MNSTILPLSRELRFDVVKSDSLIMLHIILYHKAPDHPIDIDDHEFTASQVMMLPADFSHRQSSTKKNDKRVCLGVNFNPGNNAVICGRGKACCESPGNLKLKSIVNSFTQSYATAMTKELKSAIISRIVLTVKQTMGGQFVKYEEGTWWEVDDGYAKEKVGYMLRDLLHTKYRSSTRGKEARKKVGPNLALGSDYETCHGGSHLHGGVKVLQPEGKQDHCHEAFDKARNAMLLEQSMAREVMYGPELLNASRTWFSNYISESSAGRIAEHNGLSPACLGPLHSSTTSNASGKSAVEALSKQNISVITEYSRPGSQASTGEDVPVDGTKWMGSGSKILLSSNDTPAAPNLAPGQSPVIGHRIQYTPHSTTSTNSIAVVSDDVCRDDQDLSSIGTIEFAETLPFSHDDSFQDISNIF